MPSPWLALLAFVASVHWAHGHADRQYGAMWPQILATALGYGVFLAALAAAVLVRWRWLRGAELQSQAVGDAPRPG